MRKTLFLLLIVIFLTGCTPPLCQEPNTKEDFYKIINDWTYNNNSNPLSSCAEEECEWVFSRDSQIKIKGIDPDCKELMQGTLAIETKIRNRNIYSSNNNYMWCGGSERNFVFQSNNLDLVRKYFEEFC